MKNQYVLLFLFCFSTSLLISQSNWRMSPTFTLGYTGERVFNETPGGVPTNLSYESIEEKRLLPSLGAGFGIERLIGKRWGINLGIHYYYSQIFERTEFTYYGPQRQLASYNKHENKFVTHQIQSPLEIHFYFGKPGKIRPYLSVGAQVNYLVAADEYTESLSAYNSEVYHDTWENKYDLSEEWSGLERFQFGARYGVGVDFNRFSIEFNRINNNIEKTRGSEYNGYVNCDCYYVPSTTETIQSTSVSIKFNL